MLRLRAGIAFGVAAAALSFGAGAAHAHGGSRASGYVSTFSALEPNVLGVFANVSGANNQIRLSNYSGKTVVVLGLLREPYLLLAHSSVYENLASPTAYLNASRTTPGFSAAGAKPRWQKVARSASYTWHDHRIVWAGKQPPLAVRRAPREPHLIFRWRIPATANGEPFGITGFLGWAPPPKPRGGGTSAWLVAAGVGAAVLVAGAVGAGVRRARRRTP